MDKNHSWFEEFNKSQNREKLKTNPVAYFCAEYALTSNLPIYAGGLGVLAGDLLREANTQSLPLVAIGLYYNDGYESLHNVDQKGYIEAPHIHKLPESYGLEPVLDENGKLLTITVPIGERQVVVRAWRWQTGMIPVFLLDTGCDENSPEDRKITDHLYVIDRETRLRQEIVLGIGGARMLKKFKVTPSIYHMNDGHPSLLAYEVIKDIMDRQNLSFEDAAKKAREKIVFTNHTLVTGGQEIFSNDLVSLLLSSYAAEQNIPWDKFISLGKVQDANSFSLTNLSLTSAGLINAVSKIHAKYARNLWPNYSLFPITNGINIPFWNAIADEAFWESHIENKRALLEKIYHLTGKHWVETDLIIGWARRLVEYKRPMALLENVEALKELFKNTSKPFKIVFSGRLHPSDLDATKTLENFHKIIEEALPGNAVFLPEYDMDTAKLMVSGSDVWLNTPVVGFEACGTSGMKAALNGVLPLSTRDGWIDEIELLDKGWGLDNDHIGQSIIGTLKNDILPLYYNRDAKGVPQTWLRNMKNCRELIKNDFSTTRMLREYIEKLYLPLLTQNQK